MNFLDCLCLPTLICSPPSVNYHLPIFPETTAHCRRPVWSHFPQVSSILCAAASTISMTIYCLWVGYDGQGSTLGTLCALSYFIPQTTQWESGCILPLLMRTAEAQTPSLVWGKHNSKLHSLVWNPALSEVSVGIHLAPKQGLPCPLLQLKVFQMSFLQNQTGTVLIPQT